MMHSRSKVGVKVIKSNLWCTAVDIRGSALPSAAKSNKSHYQSNVFVCVSVIIRLYGGISYSCKFLELTKKWGISALISFDFSTFILVNKICHPRHFPLFLFQTATEDEKLLQDLGAAATAVTKALNDLLQHIKRGVGDREVSILKISFLLAIRSPSESHHHLIWIFKPHVIPKISVIQCMKD